MQLQQHCEIPFWFGCNTFFLFDSWWLCEERSEERKKKQHKQRSQFVNQSLNHHFPIKIHTKLIVETFFFWYFCQNFIKLYLFLSFTILFSSIFDDKQLPQISVFLNARKYESSYFDSNNIRFQRQSLTVLKKSIFEVEMSLFIHNTFFFHFCGGSINSVHYF